MGIETLLLNNIDKIANLIIVAPAAVSSIVITWMILNFLKWRIQNGPPKTDINIDVIIKKVSEALDLRYITQEGCANRINAMREQTNSEIKELSKEVRENMAGIRSEMSLTLGEVISRVESVDKKVDMAMNTIITHLSNRG